MYDLAETPGSSKARLLFVFFFFLALIALAHGGAELKGWMDARTATDTHTKLEHTTLYYRIVFTIWVTTALLTAALCFYIFARSGERNSWWLGFWTTSYLAFLCHLYWSIGVMFGFDFHELFHSQEGVATDPERVVQQPGPDLFLAAWWTLDVVLAWVISSDRKWVQVQRGALHLLAFSMFFGATVLATKASIVAHLLGILMAIIVTSVFVLRLVVRESDPKSFLTAMYVKVFQILNLFLPWHKLPTFLAVANLGALREVLRAKNLHNTSDLPVTRPEGERKRPVFEAKYSCEREKDGFYNDLTKPAMGSASLNTDDPTTSSDFTRSTPGARFGRNIPLSAVGPLRTERVTEPNPRLISSNLLARPAGNFTPAGILNLLAAAWIQFQTHDWFNHGTPVKGNEFGVPLPPGDSWAQNPMRIRRTRPDPTRADPNKPYPDGGPADGVGPATYANAETHWWDASEIYGSSMQAAGALRSGVDGKIKVGADHLVPMDMAGLEETGLTVNWWVGLSILHNLFALEHNAICDHVKRAYPDWTDDELYRTARMVNAALIAKIHTVDWTPAILPNPALQIGMNANWWGLARERTKKSFGRISTSEAISGIPGSETAHHAGDYCLTEEFVSVYRMHPLMPDNIALISADSGKPLHTFKLGSEIDDDPDDVVGPHSRDRALKRGSMTDLIYSFGITNPGALVLRNFPNWMRKLRRMKGGRVDEIIDLATIDIVRDRERGVPRYNRFRELFHLPRYRSLDQMIRQSKQLREDAKLADELRTIYKGDIDQVDLMVGMYAETPPELFGFSDTAFRVFILMASRRLKSDRFITKDYTPAVYTQAGLDWIENNNMTSVLLRHYPELTPALQNVPNPFGPWQPVGALKRSTVPR
jgi:hypothetical protein